MFFLCFFSPDNIIFEANLFVAISLESRNLQNTSNPSVSFQPWSPRSWFYLAKLFLQSPLTVVCEVVGSNNWKRGLTRGLKYLYLLTARIFGDGGGSRLVTENTWVCCPPNPRKLGFFGCGNVTTICRLHHGGSWYDHGCCIPVAQDSQKISLKLPQPRVLGGRAY